MSIVVQLSDPTARLMFPCGADGSTGIMNFTILIEENAADPNALGFELCNDPPELPDTWACTLVNDEEDQSVRLEAGEAAANIVLPDLETFVFEDEFGPVMLLLFEMKCREKDEFLPALNVVPDDMDAGFPLVVYVQGGPVRGKKIKILHPGH